MAFTYQGNQINQPGVIMTQSSSGMTPPTTTNRLVVLLGTSSGGGKPNTLQMLNGTQDVLTKLVGGSLQTAAMRAYKDASAPYIAYMRVNPATQSTVSLVDTSSNVVATIKSVDYGAYTQRIGYEIQAGTTSGYLATVGLDGNNVTQDNISLNAFSVQYTGAQPSAYITISNKTGQIQGYSGASGTETLAWTASFATYKTVQQVVSFIAAQTGWASTILAANPNQLIQDFVDGATKAQCTAVYTVTANFTALVNWMNQQTSLVTVTRATGVDTQPTPVPLMQYLLGGSDGTTANTNWADALTALQNIPNVRIIVPVTGDASIHAMVATHCSYMSGPTVRMNRVSICGGVQGETSTAAISRAQALNTRRVSLVYPGIQDNDDITGALTTYDPYYVAAQLAGILSTLPVTQALTRQQITALALENSDQQTLQKTDYDALSSSGVMAIKFVYNVSTGNSYQVVRSLTTWQQDTALDNLELSMVCNEDAVELAVGDALDLLVGKTGGPVGPGQAASEVDSTLRALRDVDGIIVGDQNMPAYGDVSASMQGDQVIVTYSATIPVPMNYFGVTTNFRAYATVSAA